VILAQGDPSSILLSVFPGIGAILLVIAIVSFVTMVTSRKRRTATGVATRPNTANPWARSIFAVSLALLLLCIAGSVSVMESFPTHAWRNSTYYDTVTAVDDDSGRSLPIQAGLAPLFDVSDPYFVWSSTNKTPDEIVIECNATVPLTITSDGYADKTIDLSRRSPPSMVVRLSPKPSLPTTNTSK
jgi:hypothetical protein